MKRAASLFISGRVPHSVNLETAHHKSIAYPDRPGLWDIRTKDEYELVARYTPQGLLLWCKRCKHDHLLHWYNEDYLRAQELLQSGPSAPTRYSILCIDGVRLQIAFPGERYEGIVTVLLTIAQPITSD